MKNDLKKNKLKIWKKISKNVSIFFADIFWIFKFLSPKSALKYSNN